MDNRIVLNIQLACKNLHGLPTQKQFKSWVQNIFLIHKKK